MLAVVFGLPLVFGLLVWRSYRVARARAAAGEAYQPEGKLRWDGLGSAGDPR